MKNIIIIHGSVSKEEFSESPLQSAKHWLPWAKEQLSTLGYTVNIPEMPEPYKPVYEEWKNILEKFEIGEETILIGHSCGGGFLVRWLSEHNIRVGKLILVAPWLDPKDELKNGFFDFEIHSNLVEKTKDGITMFYSTDDEEDILESVEKIKSVAINIKIVEFSDKGHFTESDAVTELPEILEEIKDL